MSTLYMMCGFSRAGKTTKATALEAETGAFRISVDEWRWRLHRSDERNPEAAAPEYAETLLRHGFDVIYDDLNLYRRGRRDILRRLPATVRKVCVWMDTPKEVLRSRGGYQYPGKLQAPTEDEGFDEIWRIT